MKIDSALKVDGKYCLVCDSGVVRFMINSFGAAAKEHVSEECYYLAYEDIENRMKLENLLSEGKNER